MDALVSTEWLAGQIDTPDLRILDATFFAFEPERDTAAEYRAAHIPGALFMDLGGLADPASDLPSMLPPADLFASRMAALGLNEDSRILLYDNSPHHTSARAWWMLRTFGATRVAILDGGLPKWRAEGRPIASGTEHTAPASFSFRRDDAAVRSLDQMKAIVANRTEQIVDARGAPRFTGAEADPRGLASGHIPGSRNLPYTRLFNPDGTWKRGGALRLAFEEAGVDLSRPLVTTCGSGITAAILLFGAFLIGTTNGALYDGSWSDWGARPDTDKAMGEA